MIKRFRGRYFFLSNLSSCVLKINGLVFPSVENAFQSFKTLDLEKRKEFTTINPLFAKKLGKEVELREDWEEVKVRIMYELVYLKFSTNPILKKCLLNTGHQKLVEGNHYGDDFWGYDLKKNKGRNVLGKILMEVRKELRSGK